MGAYAILRTFAAAVIATIPALLLMALGQRFIVRGLTMGSVK